MKRYFAIASLVAVSLSLVAEQKLFTAKLKNNKAVDIVQLESTDKECFACGKAVFMKSFGEAYKNYTPEQLYLENKPGYLEKFLDAAFEDEENDFNANKKGCVCVVAKEAGSNKVIGFVAYDISEVQGKIKVYVRQLAIDPSCKRLGLGQTLVLDTIKAIVKDKAATVTVGTRKINEPAVELYKKLNFQDATMQEVHPELAEYKYRGFKLELQG